MNYYRLTHQTTAILNLVTVHFMRAWIGLPASVLVYIPAATEDCLLSSVFLLNLLTLDHHRLNLKFIDSCKGKGRYSSSWGNPT